MDGIRRRDEYSRRDVDGGRKHTENTDEHSVSASAGRTAAFGRCRMAKRDPGHKRLLEHHALVFRISLRHQPRDARSGEPTDVVAGVLLCNLCLLCLLCNLCNLWLRDSEKR
jgi:hypothetical protein